MKGSAFAGPFSYGASEMKWLTLGFGVLSAASWLRAAFIQIPFGWDTDADRHRAEKRIAYYNAGGAIFAAATAISGAFAATCFCS